MGQTVRSKLKRLDIAISSGNIVKDEKIDRTFRKLKERIEMLNNKYGYVDGLTEEEIEDKLKKFADVKPIGNDAELAENRREYIYKYLLEMDKANNATLYANRKELEELHEAYTTDIEGTLGIQAIEFKSMEEIEQREIMAKLAEAETYCENYKTKQKIHNKRIEFYDILCADTMYDAKDIDKMLQQQTANQRQKVKPIRLE